MSKKRSWLGLIKRLFFPETHHQQKITRRRRWLFGRLKRTKTLPSPSPLIQKTEHHDDDDDEEEEQKQSIFEDEGIKDQASECETELENHSEVTRNDEEDDDNNVKTSLISENESTCDQIVAAITIQTTFRCYLCLQSIAKIQSQVCARRCQKIRGKDGDLLMLQDLKNQNSKHSADAILDGKSQGRLRYWLEQHVVSNEVVPNKKEDIKSLPRSSFHKHRKQNSYGDQDSLHSNSPTNLPTYMAATESAKARTRSTSSPRLRPIHMDAYSDNDSPYKNKTFSPMSSINSEATCSGFSKKSPSFKGVSGPVRSNKNV
ncbi:Protein IQ-DOMAIN 14, partial [Bienertia sinuspersici]